MPHLSHVTGPKSEPASERSISALEFDQLVTALRLFEAVRILNSEYGIVLTPAELGAMLLSAGVSDRVLYLLDDAASAGRSAASSPFHDSGYGSAEYQHSEGAESVPLCEPLGPGEPDFGVVGSQPPIQRPVAPAQLPETVHAVQPMRPFTGAEMEFVPMGGNIHMESTSVVPRPDITFTGAEAEFVPMGVNVHLASASSVPRSDPTVSNDIDEPRIRHFNPKNLESIKWLRCPDCPPVGECLARRRVHIYFDQVARDTKTLVGGKLEESCNIESWHTPHPRKRDPWREHWRETVYDPIPEGVITSDPTNPAYHDMERRRDAENATISSYIRETQDDRSPDFSAAIRHLRPRQSV